MLRVFDGCVYGQGRPEEGSPNRERLVNLARRQTTLQQSHQGPGFRMRVGMLLAPGSELLQDLGLTAPVPIRGRRQRHFQPVGPVSV